LSNAFQKLIEDETVRILSPDGRTKSYGVIKEKLAKSNKWLVLDLSDNNLKELSRSDFRKKSGFGIQNPRNPKDLISHSS